MDILVFFGVLLVGFAYLWRRGDIDWVRSTTSENVAGSKPEDCRFCTWVSRSFYQRQERNNGTDHSQSL